MEITGNESDETAIRALGSLFKLTRVFIWDDGTTEIRKASSLPKHIRFKYDDHDDDEDDKISSNNTPASPGTTDAIDLPEDLDLSQQLTALGLPLSFCTSKDRNGSSKGKRKGKHVKNQYSLEKVKEDELRSAKFSEDDNLPYAIFSVETSNSSSLSLPGQSDLSCCNGTVEIDEMINIFPGGGMLENLSAESALDAHEQFVHDGLTSNISSVNLNHEFMCANSVLEEEIISAATASNLSMTVKSLGDHIHDNAVDQGQKKLDGGSKEHVNPEDYFSGNNVIVAEECGTGVITEQLQAFISNEHSSNVLGHEEINRCRCSGSFGDWRACWDSFYSRNFFYNVKTQESTWDPPPGMEYIAFSNILNLSSDSNAEMSKMDVDPVVSNNGSVLGNPCDLLDKTAFDGECGGGDGFWGQPELADGKLACVMKMFSDDVIGNSSKLHEFDGNHQDGIASIDQKHSAENDTKQIGTNAICGGDLEKKVVNEDDGLNLFENTCRIACSNQDDGAMAQLSGADSLPNAASGAVCYKGLISHMDLESMETPADEFDSENVLSAMKRKKVRKTSRKKSFDNDEQLLNGQLQCQYTVENIHVDISKYWWQRYILFSRFDLGVKMDEEGWFSVTPEPIARHQASRCGCGIVIDCFAGVGGNAIQFAKRSNHVIAIDIDPKKIEYTQHNAHIYGVEGQIDFVIGDSFLLARKLKADTVFLSPPWGGPDYCKVRTYDIEMLKPHDGQFLFDTFKEVAPRLVMFLPRNVNLNQLAELSLSVNPPWSLEVEKNFLNGKLKAVTAYFSRNAEWKVEQV
ncbi:hypothetical protein Nepgr_015657 [Nepenthes gracilis]|uniref:Trimethylguanosine synthase n=1 Tax=Nepenthes gracilis TaxID=150966 RepID=A0AAD3XRH8_NEPGR|nr:hypothetical protein Nepgr_015657 [Nepenthes gracilis]